MQASTAKVEAGGISRIKKLLEPVERLEGGIVKGFQRGRELGWPTANLNPRAFEGLTLEQGVYFGWARISSEDVVYMAMISIGNNPTFDNPTKSLEVYLCHDFGRDFYEDTLKLIICGYMRPQVKIPWDDLIGAISEDVHQGKHWLDDLPFAEYKQDDFFSTNVAFD